MLGPAAFLVAAVSVTCARTSRAVVAVNGTQGKAPGKQGSSPGAASGVHFQHFLFLKP